MNNTKKYLFLIIVFLIGVSGAFFGNKIFKTDNSSSLPLQTKNAPIPSAKLCQHTPHQSSSVASVQPVNFIPAAAISTPSVVHIKTTYNPKPANRQRQSYPDPFGGFFGEDFFQFFGSPQQQNQSKQASGSGVILSEDGYIVTNNHVIEGADDIEVILYDKKSYKATLIGTDKDTDLGLLKIESEEVLPKIHFSNSDSVMIGEWVLAVGNPFNLSSTVTAGIVSAKGRNINIIGNSREGSNTAIESFIQTDAAVNPGNSGGALVNTKGELIGINTAIATPTGSYAGYSFAVPSNLVKKVIADLKEYGIVQRGFIGVGIKSVDNSIAKELNLKSPTGVLIESVVEGGAADKAGIKKKDVIISINDVQVNTAPELQEQVASYRPGDNIKVSFIRSGKTKSVTLTLRNKDNKTALVDDDASILEKLGVKLEPIQASNAQKLRIKGGLKVIDINKGLLYQTGIKEGFIITTVDDKSVHSISELSEILRYKSGNVIIEGIYPSKPSDIKLYAFKLE